VKKIGARTKVSNDKDVKAIEYRQTPEIMFVEPGEEGVKNDFGYSYFNLPSGYKTMFSQSA
jgi:hypothetical protein